MVCRITAAGAGAPATAAAKPRAKGGVRLRKTLTELPGSDNYGLRTALLQQAMHADTPVRRLLTMITDRPCDLGHGLDFWSLRGRGGSGIRRGRPRRPPRRRRRGLGP